MRILVVEDEPVNRLVLTRSLRQWGHEVVSVADGAMAWDLMQREPFRMVISDWVMPEMDGIELTRRIRAAAFGGYVYVVLLTARAGVAALVEGMEAGADDFMVKPFQPEELRARVRAGERVLQLETDLAERNRRLGEAYATQRRDLEAAAEMQAALLPAQGLQVPWVRPAWRFLPASLVAGDVIGVHALDAQRTGFYLLDVAGHGVPSAMLSFSLSKILSPDGMLLEHGPAGSRVLEPAEVLERLNARFQADVDSMKYFTILYGIVDAAAGTLTLAQGGHTSPVLVAADGVRTLGDSGFPVGMLPCLEFEQQTLPFAPGDRLYLYSDGVTECTNADREPWRLERLRACVEAGAAEPLEASVAAIESALRAWRGGDAFADDVTLLAIEREAA
jgi:sigma-B regulation protein RsbU (phosphoserine phosphatase)